MLRSYTSEAADGNSKGIGYPQLLPSASPTPPVGLPPARPPLRPNSHVLQHHDDRVRPAVRFRELPSLRSHSYDDFPRRHSIDEEEADAPAKGSVPHHILVAVRCRPLHNHEAQSGGRAVVKAVEIGACRIIILEDPQTTAADDYLRLNKSKERRYAFDEVFSDSATTREVYDGTARCLIGGVLQGFNATVFAYGATGAGKTHTMLGNADEPGIMMMTLLDLFSEVDNQRETTQCEVKCSFLEVYNENIRDLLRPDGDYLDIREDPVRGMCVAGISEVGGLESAREIMMLLQQANRNRTTEATGANVTSSRSHALLQVVVEQRDKTAGILAQVNVGKLSMIDLAGSERACVTNNKGMRMIEGANINRSLLALGNCITALSSAMTSFVPFRDSKMTRLLKDSLGGNCRTVMIANCSPCHFNYEDTHNTLKYANRARNIKTKAVRNTVRVTTHASKYTELIKDLKKEIADLKGKLASAPEQICISEISSQWSEPNREEVKSPPFDENIAAESAASATKWKQELMQNFEERVSIKRQLIDLAQEAQNLKVEKSRAQLSIGQWESSQVRATDDAVDRSVGANGADPCTPRSIEVLREKLKNFKAESASTEATTKELEQLLLANQQKAERLQVELPSRVQNKDLRQFLTLVSRLYVMEVENMDLQEMSEVTVPLIQQKDLEAEALRLQIQMRDQMIAEQEKLLATEGVAPMQKVEGWIAYPVVNVKKGLPSLGELCEKEEGSFGDGGGASVAREAVLRPVQRVRPKYLNSPRSLGNRHPRASSEDAIQRGVQGDPEAMFPPLVSRRGAKRPGSRDCFERGRLRSRSKDATRSTPPPIEEEDELNSTRRPSSCENLLPSIEGSVSPDKIGMVRKRNNARKVRRENTGRTSARDREPKQIMAYDSDPLGGQDCQDVDADPKHPMSVRGPQRPQQLKRYEPEVAPKADAGSAAERKSIISRLNNKMRPPRFFSAGAGAPRILS